MASDSCLAGNRTLPGQDRQYVLAVKVIAGTVCLLSILGASLIILTFVAFKDLRTIIRQMLVNLSVANILVALFHFLGLFTNYDRFSHGGEASQNLTRDWWCSTQGALVALGSVGAFFWTTAIGLYLVVVVVLRSPLAGKRLLMVFYAVCWGVPTVIVVVFGPLHLFGFSRAYGIGWCFIYSGMYTTKSTALLAELFAYDLWTYITFPLLPSLYLTVHCYLLTLRRCCYRGEQLGTQSTGVPPADLKFIFVPLIFIFLRIWSFVVDILFFYVSEEQQCNFLRNEGVLALQFIANVGNSSQGLANGILFCAFTRIVRKKLAVLLCCHGSSCPCRKHHRETVMAEVSTPNRVTFEDTEELLEESVSRTWEVQMPHSSLIPTHFHWGRGNTASLDAGGEYGSQSEAMYHGL